MVLNKQKVLITMKLPQLQNLIKRDPASYKDEFMVQKQHFESELEIFKLHPGQDSDRFSELVDFISHVCSCYPNECIDIPTCLIDLLENYTNIIHPDIRAKVFQCLILIRNKGLLDPLVLIKLSFKLFSVNDKSLRSIISDYIVNDIKSINSQRSNDKLNRSIQAYLFNIVAEDTSTKARKTVEILSELYRKRIWSDARTVNVISSACKSKAIRVVLVAICFFLGIESKMLEDEEEEKSETKNITINYHEHSKKTRKRQRHVQRQKEKKSKMERLKEKRIADSNPLFPAIMMINDPYSLVEILFRRLRQTNERFDTKLLLMNFISRLIGCHRLQILSFYSFLQRYLNSHQQDVTQILAYLIQASHELIPPEEIIPVMKTIAYNFITERCSNEVIAVGINSIREIISRVPSVLKEEGMDDFIQDLAMYSRKTHKSVMMAANSVINLVREIYPSILKKTDRGKFHNPTIAPKSFGQFTAAESIDGADLLEAFERGDIIQNDDGDFVWKEDMDGDTVKSNEESDENGNESGEEDIEDEEEWEEVDENDELDDGEEDDEEEEEEEEVSWEEASSEESEAENNEGDWIDVDGSASEIEEDQENPENQEKSSDDDNSEAPLAVPYPEDKYAKFKNRIDASRVLSNEDFEMIARLKAAQAERNKDPRFRGKLMSSFLRLNENSLEDEEDGGASNAQDYAFQPDQLESKVRSKKASKLERLKSIIEGRKENKFEHEGHAGGLTNKEKSRKKNYMMVRKGKESVVKKLKRSNFDTRMQKLNKKEQFGREKRKRRRI